MPDSIKTVQVIINPASGQDAPMLAIMNRAFRAAKVDWDVKLTKEAGDAERFAREAIAAGVDAVGVYGGDGTVMEVASGMNKGGRALAIFPGGSANVMSVELGIPGNLEEAVALVCSDARQIRQIDMGRLGDQQMFMLRLGIGFFAETTKGADREVKNRVGVLALWPVGAASPAEGARNRFTPSRSTTVKLCRPKAWPPSSPIRAASAFPG
ncbi:MAG: hypothetical protein IPK17_21855 [Chloroflexi bacterium]|uniref:diacylglycerol/lipid kinase family protein n=1 Tax=Candidatus Flexifilum breve TaxID=3140694 RepID=UPI003135FE39|nr:hypothetical protein [Chloroflexota bacterium]